jgi:hypothetical protein
MRLSVMSSVPAIRPIHTMMRKLLERCEPIVVSPILRWPQNLRKSETTGNCQIIAIEICGTEVGDLGRYAGWMRGGISRPSNRRPRLLAPAVKPNVPQRGL